MPGANLSCRHEQARDSCGQRMGACRPPIYLVPRNGGVFVGASAWARAGLVVIGQQAIVIDTGAFTVFVENMDRSPAFYHDVFDMEVPALPPTGARASW